MCCIYRSCSVRTSIKISSEDRYLVLLKKNILIPEGARACAEHTENRRLTMEAIDRVAPYSVQQHQLDASDVQLLLTKAQMLYEQKKRFDFNHPSSLSDHEYHVLTSLSKEHFGDLIGRISTSNIRNTNNRGESSIYDAFRPCLRDSSGRIVGDRCLE